MPFGSRQPDMVLRQPRLRMALIFAVTLGGFVLLSAHLFGPSAPPVSSFAWLKLCLAAFGCGVGAIAAAYHTIFPQQLTLSDRGFVLCGLFGFTRKTAWSDIGRIYLWQYRRTRCVALEYVGGREPTGIGASLRRMLGAPAGLPSGWTIPVEKLLSEMQARHQRAIAR